jgi:hypothetical protein
MTDLSSSEGEHAAQAKIDHVVGVKCYLAVREIFCLTNSTQDRIFQPVGKDLVYGLSSQGETPLGARMCLSNLRYLRLLSTT